MKRSLPLVGLLSIAFSVVLTSCVSSGKLITTKASQADVMSRLKSLMDDSLVNFKDDNSGSVYVSVQGKMLFKPGSASVDLKGKKALRPLAELLYVADDFTMMVKGNIDTVALKKAKYANNWALSQARAASIMSILTETVKDRIAEQRAA